MSSHNLSFLGRGPLSSAFVILKVDIFPVIYSPAIRLFTERDIVGDTSSVRARVNSPRNVVVLPCCTRSEDTLCFADIAWATEAKCFETTRNTRRWRPNTSGRGSCRQRRRRRTIRKTRLHRRIIISSRCGNSSSACCASMQSLCFCCVEHICGKHSKELCMCAKRMKLLEDYVGICCSHIIERPEKSVKPISGYLVECNRSTTETNKHTPKQKTKKCWLRATAVGFENIKIVNPPIQKNWQVRYVNI